MRFPFSLKLEPGSEGAEINALQNCFSVITFNLALEYWHAWLSTAPKPVSVGL